MKYYRITVELIECDIYTCVPYTIAYATSVDIILIDKLSCYASQWFDDYGNAKGSHDSLEPACLK